VCGFSYFFLSVASQGKGDGGDLEALPPVVVPTATGSTRTGKRAALAQAKPPSDTAADAAPANDDGGGGGPFSIAQSSSSAEDPAGGGDTASVLADAAADDDIDVEDFVRKARHRPATRAGGGAIRLFLLVALCCFARNNAPFCVSSRG
jgi:hypothetical protein